jgi:hypothetical protein
MAPDSPIRRREGEEAEVPLSGMREEFRAALRAEIEAAERTAATAAIPLADGRKIGRLADAFQNAFGAEAAINAAGDCAAELSIGGRPPVEAVVLPAMANDPNAWLKDVKPFQIESSSQFRSKGPLVLTSRKYARELDEVKSLGSAAPGSPRTPDQTLAARYWAGNPPGTWSRIFRTLSGTAGAVARRERALRRDALSDLNGRPHQRLGRQGALVVLAAAHGDRGGGHGWQPRTEPELGWRPLIPNPPHPEHPSGHTGLSGSIVKTLQQFFRIDNVAWSDGNNAGLTRSFTRFSQFIGAQAARVEGVRGVQHEEDVETNVRASPRGFTAMARSDAAHGDAVAPLLAQPGGQVGRPQERGVH